MSQRTGEVGQEEAEAAVQLIVEVMVKMAWYGCRISGTTKRSLSLLCFWSGQASLCSTSCQGSAYIMSRALDLPEPGDASPPAVCGTFHPSIPGPWVRTSFVAAHTAEWQPSSSGLLAHSSFPVPGACGDASWQSRNTSHGVGYLCLSQLSGDLEHFPSGR